MGWSVQDLADKGSVVAPGLFQPSIANPGGFVDTLTGGGDQRKAKESFKQTEEEANKAYEESMKQIEADKAKQTSINAQMAQKGNEYNEWGQQITDSYQKDIGGLLKEAEGQATDARKVYQNSIQPAQKNNMEIAQRNAMGAMTLADAQDPNNALQSGIRGYFNDQSQGAMRQGMQSAGVADAFAAQEAEMGNQSGAPQTGAQQQARYANATQQANRVRGNTMAKAAAIQDQGIQTAQAANDEMYNQGLRAQDEAAGAAADYQKGYLDFNDMMGGARGEQMGYSNDMLGSQLGQAESSYGTNQATADRNFQTEQDALKNQLAAIQQKYGIQSGSKGAEASAYQGRAEGIGGLFNAAAGAAGKAAGSM